MRIFQLDKLYPMCYTKKVMKYTILLCILSDLLEHRHLTAGYLSEKYEISPRTVYRYVEILSAALPVQVKRGRGGGVSLSESYKLPAGYLSKAEFERVITALSQAYSDSLDEEFLAVKRKIAAQMKTETRTPACVGSAQDIFVLNELTRGMKEKARVLEECIRDRMVTKVEYLHESQEKIQDRIEPHAIVFRENVGYVYAFSYKNRDFIFLPLGRIFTLVRTNERFAKRPIPPSSLLDSPNVENPVFVRLKIPQNALTKAQDKLGIETLREKEGEYFADISFPDEDTALYSLLTFGGGAEILSPSSLRSRLRELAQEIADMHR